MGLETFVFQKKGLRSTQWLFTLWKPFIEYSLPLTVSVSCHHYFMTRYFVPCYFQLMFTETLLRETEKTACLMFLNAPWKSLTCRSNDFLWHSESSSAVTLVLHADWMMLKNSSNQGGANSMTLAPWHTKSQPRMLVASKAVFLKTYLAVSTWILKGSSIECLKKKYLNQCHLLCNLHSLQKVIHWRNRETTRRQIPRTPSRRRERRQKRI